MDPPLFFVTLLSPALCLAARVIIKGRIRYSLPSTALAHDHGPSQPKWVSPTSLTFVTCKYSGLLHVLCIERSSPRLCKASFFSPLSSQHNHQPREFSLIPPPESPPHPYGLQSFLGALSNRLWNSHLPVGMCVVFVP